MDEAGVLRPEDDGIESKSEKREIDDCARGGVRKASDRLMGKEKTSLRQTNLGRGVGRSEKRLSSSSSGFLGEGSRGET